MRPRPRPAPKPPSGPQRTSRVESCPMQSEAIAVDELWLNLRLGWDWRLRHRSNSERCLQASADRQRQNFFAAFCYSAACALVTSRDSLCITFPFGDSPISLNKTAKVAARACLLETTEPAVIHTASHRGFALLPTDFRQSILSRSLSFLCQSCGYFSSKVLPIPPSARKTTA